MKKMQYIMLATTALLSHGLALSEQSSKQDARLSSRTFLERYNDDRDYRPLVFDALQAPKSGGLYYAHRILKQCATIGEGSAFESMITTDAASIDLDRKRADALSLLKSRCEKFSSDELSDSYIEEIRNQGLRQGDPLVRASANATSDHRDSGEAENVNRRRKRAIASAMSFPDPLLIDEIGLRLILQTRNEGQSSKKSFRLDGKDIPLKGSGTDVDAGLALTLVPCKLGLRCDSTEFATAIQCATGGDCDDGRGDALRKAFEKNQKAPADLFVRTDQLADRIANALLHKQKNVLSD